MNGVHEYLCCEVKYPFPKSEVVMKGSWNSKTYQMRSQHRHIVLKGLSKINFVPLTFLFFSWVLQLRADSAEQIYTKEIFRQK